MIRAATYSLSAFVSTKSCFSHKHVFRTIYIYRRRKFKTRTGWIAGHHSISISIQCLIFSKSKYIKKIIDELYAEINVKVEEKQEKRTVSSYTQKLKNFYDRKQ
jgi:hypothetical protein